MENHILGNVSICAIYKNKKKLVLEGPNEVLFGSKNYLVEALSTGDISSDWELRLGETQWDFDDTPNKLKYDISDLSDLNYETISIDAPNFVVDDVLAEGIVPNLNNWKSDWTTATTIALPQVCFYCNAIQPVFSKDFVVKEIGLARTGKNLFSYKRINSNFSTKNLYRVLVVWRIQL